MTIPGAKTKQFGCRAKNARRLRVSGSRGLLRREHHLRNTGRNSRPSDCQPVGQTVEGLDYRFLRSQLRVIGPGSLRKTRLRRSEYNLNTHPYGLNNNRSTGTLQTLAVAR